MNTHAIIQSLLAVCWALAAAGATWHVSRIARQITYVTLADGRRQERAIPILFRLLLPLSPNLAPLWRRPAFAKTRTEVDARLVAGGYEGLLSADEMLAIRVLVPLVYGTLWVIFMRGAVTASHVAFLAKGQFALYAIGVLWLALYPFTWLRQAIAARHRVVQRALPFVLDLLTLSVEAGMDFMSALQRNIDRRRIDALSEELIRVVREIQLGATRRQALRGMSRRVNLADLRSVVNALCQADELGVSIGSILRIQADQMRLRRFERAEKLANEAPVKMLFPLMVFIFPAVFLVLLGPVIYRMVQQGF